MPRAQCAAGMLRPTLVAALLISADALKIDGAAINRRALFAKAASLVPLVPLTLSTLRRTQASSLLKNWRR